MLEIFALPYVAVSGAIGGLIFGPFFRTENPESSSPTGIAICDLLAVTLPVSVLFSLVRWMIPESILSLTVQAIVIAIALLFAAFALAAGVFLVSKTYRVTFLKRMTVTGVIAPLGMLLTVGWIGLMIWAGAYSTLYLVPSSVVIAAATLGLRLLSVWVCLPDPEATNQQELAGQ